MSRASQAKPIVREIRTTPTFKVGDYVRDVDTGIIGQVSKVWPHVGQYLVTYLTGFDVWYADYEVIAWEPRIGEPVQFGVYAPDAVQSLIANVTGYADGYATTHIPAVGFAIVPLRALEPITLHDAAGGLTKGDHVQVVKTNGLHSVVKRGDLGVVTLVDGADIRVKVLTTQGTVIDQHCSAAHLRRASVH